MLSILKHGHTTCINTIGNFHTHKKIIKLNRIYCVFQRHYLWCETKCSNITYQCEVSPKDS